MNLKFISVLIFLTLKIISSYVDEATETNKKIDTEISLKSNTGMSIMHDSNQKWRKLCQLLTEMMLNCDHLKKNKVDVAIYTIGNKEYFDQDYDGFQQTLMTYGLDKITISQHDILSNATGRVQGDFYVMLIHENIIDYKAFIEEEFTKIFSDISIKIFLILTHKLQLFDNLVETWHALCMKKYFNVYVVNHEESGWFEIFRTALKRVNPYQVQTRLQEVKKNKFLMLKDVLIGDEFPFIRLVFYNSYPLSYVKDGVIHGADGNLINEFSKRIDKPYLVINNYTAKPSLDEINAYIHTASDINLCTYVTIHSKNIEIVWIYQMHGTCLLVPRNIPVSAYENISVLIDSSSMIMILISTISVIFCWKLLTKEMSITSIIFAVFELTLNFGATNIGGITFREKLLVYCFIFSSFILVSYYENVVLLFMLATPTWRSAVSLEELNQSTTMFHTMFDKDIIHDNNLPRIRQELILNRVNLSELMSLEVPEKFDENLVYMVLCEYADYFIHSSRNYHNNRRLYNKIIITPYYKTYNVNREYFYIEEFTEMVKRLMESGIYGFWKKIDFEANKGNVIQYETENKKIDMRLPMYVLAIGCSIALLVFLIEVSGRKWCSSCSKQLSLINYSIRIKKKINLDKWRQRYIYKKKLSFKNILKSRKDQNIPSKYGESYLPLKHSKDVQIKCRESVDGDYFMIRKFKKQKKSKPLVLMPTGYRFIQVQPYSNDHDEI